MRPAAAHSGLKLRAVFRYTRLPCRSPFHACTNAKSVTIASPARSSAPSNSYLFGFAQHLDRAVSVIAPRDAALRNLSANTGRREEGGNARTARAQALGQSALRAELDLEPASEVLPLVLLVLADIRAGVSANPVRLKQDPEPEAVDAESLLTVSRLVAPCSSSASIRTVGTPQAALPIAIDAPSNTSATACRADGTTLSTNSSADQQKPRVSCPPSARCRGYPLRPITVGMSTPRAWWVQRLRRTRSADRRP